jgi:hypothetical protein
VEEEDVNTNIKSTHSSRRTICTRRLASWFQRGLGISVCLLGTIAVSQTSFSGHGPSPRFTIAVANYSQAPPAVLERAQREADRIFGEAGMTAVWANCSAGQSNAEMKNLCQKAFEAADVMVRILPVPVLKIFGDSVFGFAVPPVLASVYCDYIVRLANSDGAEFEIPIILGCSVAHEIGHLLLGSNGHSDTGIMQGRWRREQVQEAMRGNLVFTVEQSKVMRAETRRRTLTPSSDTQGPSATDFVIIGGSDALGMLEPRSAASGYPLVVRTV